MAKRQSYSDTDPKTEAIAWIVCIGIVILPFAVVGIYRATSRDDSHSSQTSQFDTSASSQTGFDDTSSYQPLVKPGRTGRDWQLLRFDEKRNVIIETTGISTRDRVNWIIRAVNEFFDPHSQEAAVALNSDLYEIVQLMAAAEEADRRYVPQHITSQPRYRQDDFQSYRQHYRQMLAGARTGMEVLEIVYEIERAGLTDTQDRALDQAIRDIGLKP